jgi:anti-sigma B factor antagonist
MSSQPHIERVKVESIGDVTVASVIDRKILSEQNIQILGEQLLDLVNESDSKKLLLNFHNVEYMSSAVLGMLVTLNKKVKAVRGKLILCSIDPKIREVFAITNLDKVFVIRDDEQESLQAF